MAGVLPELLCLESPRLQWPLSLAFLHLFCLCHFLLYTCCLLTAYVGSIGALARVQEYLYLVFGNHRTPGKVASLSIPQVCHLCDLNMSVVFHRHTPSRPWQHDNHPSPYHTQGCWPSGWPGLPSFPSSPGHPASPPTLSFLLPISLTNFMLRRALIKISVTPLHWFLLLS